jgi:hypothetical protein
MEVDPLKTFPGEVHLMQRRLLDVQPIECLDVVTQITVRIILEQRPVELPRVIPLVPLANLVAHEEQFLTGMGVHVAV